MVYRLIVPRDTDHDCDGDYNNLEVVRMAIGRLLKDDAVPTFILVKLGERHDRK